MTKPKILSLIPHFGVGGAQRVFSNLNAQLSRDYDLLEVAFSGNENQDLYGNNIEKQYLGVTGGGSFLKKFFSFYKRYKSLKSIKRQHNFHACISHLEGANYLNILVFGARKSICVVHGSKLADQEVKGFFRWLEYKILIPVLFNRAYKIVTVSKGIKEEMTTYFGVNLTKTRAIPNFFDQDYISKKAEVKLEDSHTKIFEDRVLIASGRFHPQKNLEVLLTIFESCLPHFEERTRLVFLGDGDLYDHLIATCDEKGLRYYSAKENKKVDPSADIYFLGFQNNPFKFISKSDILLLPSKWEGFPLTICESLLCGTPVMSADCPTGPREILSWGQEYLPKSISNYETNEIGCLCPVPSIEDNSHSVWKEAILKTKIPKGESFDRLSRKRLEEYKVDKVMEQWYQVLDGIS